MSFTVVAVTRTVRTSSCWTRSTCWSENLSGFRPPGCARSKLTASIDLIPAHPNLPQSTLLLRPHFCLILYYSLPSPLLPTSQPTPPVSVTQAQPTSSQMPTVSTARAVGYQLPSVRVNLLIVRHQLSPDDSC